MYPTDKDTIPKEITYISLFCSDIEEQEDLIAHLIALAKKEIKPMNRAYGLCYEITKHLKPNSHRGLLYVQEGKLYNYFHSWEHYSGSEVFPVPHSELIPMAAFRNIKNLWDTSTEYGRLRYDLCKHIIGKLQKNLDDYLNYLSYKEALDKETIKTIGETN